MRPSLAHRLCRLVAPLMLALWALQPVVMVQHVGAHFHRFCVEHGVFEDVAAPAVGAAAPAAVSDARTLLPEGAVAAETAHEECGALASRTPQLAGPSAPVLARVAPAARAPARARALPGVAPVPLLHRAPKASPPAHV